MDYKIRMGTAKGVMVFEVTVEREITKEEAEYIGKAELHKNAIYGELLTFEVL